MGRKRLSRKQKDAYLMKLYSSRADIRGGSFKSTGGFVTRSGKYMTTATRKRRLAEIESKMKRYKR